MNEPERERQYQKTETTQSVPHLYNQTKCLKMYIGRSEKDNNIKLRSKAEVESVAKKQQ